MLSLVLPGLLRFYLGNDINYERIRESTTSIETLWNKRTQILDYRVQKKDCSSNEKLIDDCKDDDDDKGDDDDDDDDDDDGIEQ